MGEEDKPHKTVAIQISDRFKTVKFSPEQIAEQQRLAEQEIQAEKAKAKKKESDEP